jgi:unsaturated rhamnogalacturonyl hydrolase
MVTRSAMTTFVRLACLGFLAVSCRASGNAASDGAIAATGGTTGTATGSGGESSGTGGGNAGTDGSSAGTGGSTKDGGAPDAVGTGGATPTDASTDADATGSDGKLPATSLAVRFADSIIVRWPDPGRIGGMAWGWDYNIGIVLAGIERVYERTGDPKYLDYIRKYVDAHVNAAGALDVGANTPHSLDLIQPAGLLLFLREQTGAAKYDTAAQAVRTRFDKFPKNADGGFWHKQSYPNEMWLDGIYMAEPFLVKFGKLFPSCGAYCNDTPVAQATMVAGHALNPATGLLVHAWDQDKNALWANATTGNSSEVWSRGLGWFAMALVDILGDLPATHPGHAQLLTLLTGLAAGIKTAQDPATGLWFQVVDKGTMADNWIETSGSGMFIYALKVAVTRGYIDASYLTVAQRGYDGLKTRVTTDATGPIISDAVQGMSVQRDYASYVAQMRLSNSAHGLCGVLMAASQMD